MKNYEIVKKRALNANTYEYTIYAPLAARHCRGGQFVIVRAGENGERMPFTAADSDADAGTITMVVQTAGASTYRLSKLEEGDAVCDLVGPLGNPTDLGAYRNIILVGGGIGSAVVYPQTKELKKNGKRVTAIIGARTKELVLYAEEFKNRCDELHIVTDDGSAGVKGFVTDALKVLLEKGGYDCVFAVGPLAMMRAVSKLTESYNIHTVVSMNSIMVDGTGMCGGCRVKVGGELKYACVDGPEFDGHLIDFDEAINRNSIYKEWEGEEYCRLTGVKR